MTEIVVTIVETREAGGAVQIGVYCRGSKEGFTRIEEAAAIEIGKLVNGLINDYLIAKSDDGTVSKMSIDHPSQEKVDMLIKRIKARGHFPT